jgi:hypothetical protein
VRHLGAVQLNDRVAEDFEAYRKSLRADQVIYLTPTADMSAQRVLAISGGRGIVLQCAAPDSPR